MARKYLLVEGNDDEKVAEHLCRLYNKVLQYETKKQGVDSLSEDLPVYLKGSDVRAIGVVIDADSRVEARWNSLGAVLRKQGYARVPVDPLAAGTIVRQEGKPSVGIWIMPDDFIGFLVPNGDPMWEWAGECLDSVPLCPARFADIHRSKARIHTWLAWQREPGTPMGLAISRRYLDGTCPRASQFVNWLEELFT